MPQSEWLSVGKLLTSLAFLDCDETVLRRPGVRLDPPKIGEHTNQLLGALGLSEERIQQLAAQGIVA